MTLLNIYQVFVIRSVSPLSYNLDLPYLVHTFMIEGTCLYLSKLYINFISVSVYLDLLYAWLILQGINLFIIYFLKNSAQTIFKGQGKHKSVSTLVFTCQNIHKKTFFVQSLVLSSIKINSYPSFCMKLLFCLFLLFISKSWEHSCI